MLDRSCLWCGAPTIGDLCPRCKDAVRVAGKERADMLAAARQLTTALAEMVRLTER